MTETVKNEVRTEVDEQYGIVVFSDGDTWEGLNDEISVVYLTENAFEDFSDHNRLSILDDIEEDPILMTITIRELIDFWKENVPK
jgi:hypothetical protein